ncbi:ribosome maturation factor RimP [Desulfonispora thiosulfatigenes DSM 11270]|uniref:Ribosome maturation factor RimP n=1 Tax=Desulfonispora thiosulfatigenes DSM 11270 TaxID=656914 RepID=A0A1W1VLG8_DESTI|nr:ribosome maturation factor RimP [Desulfonispora thiosulfatigenes]SMB94060.1 ribosome maturation factor RimP [Desulfonispora thiosulfatigenes DSM 11270]
MAKVEEIIYDMADPVISELGLELVAVEYLKEGSEWFLRIYIDKEEGIELDDCEKVSHLISDKLDNYDPITQAYHLEVSSPGIERPLKKTKDFLRFLDHLVQIKTYAAIENKKTFTGILNFADEDQIILIENDVKITIPREKIAKANLVWEG